MIAASGLSIAAGGFRRTDLNFTVPPGGYTVLMGPSGCGKTTLLETLCGLRTALAGQIQVMARDVTRLKPAARNIAYVPQDRALFTPLSVYENLAFALRLRRWDSAAIDRRVDELAGLLGLHALLSRQPLGLSGGEMQRVALGRALAARPDVLLLDEPLSALDDQSRGQMHELLKSVRHHATVTVLHVTHSFEDARQLADEVLVMDRSHIEKSPRSAHPVSA